MHRNPACVDEGGSSPSPAPRASSPTSLRLFVFIRTGIIKTRLKQLSRDQMRQALWSRCCGGKESTCQRRRRGFDSWVGKVPWRRTWKPTPAFLPGKFHGQRSLAGYSLPWGCKESDTTERLSMHTSGGHSPTSCPGPVKISPQYF